MLRKPWTLFALAALFLGTGTITSAAAADEEDGHGTFFVAPGGSDTNDCRSQENPCQTITHAISLAGAGDTVKVEGGTYTEQVKISKQLRLIGDEEPTIDEAGTSESVGIFIDGANAAGSLVRGFTVKNAYFEGILAMETSHLTIENNVVNSNDQGFAAQALGECKSPGAPIPGDCGEGLHLWATTDSRVLNNVVTQNAGGILLTDETGPTSGNLISGNTASDNPFDCGITVASHSGSGIFNNSITHNVANNNGLQGEGAGILLAGAGPGTAVYNNKVISNSAEGNSLAGLTLHRHAPTSNLSGNLIIGNRFGTNNLGGDPDFGVFKTTGILIGSVSPLAGTVVRGNFVHDDHFGIWTKNVPPIPPGSNHFEDVDVPLMQT